MTIDELTTKISTIVLHFYEKYNTGFQNITKRAKERFENRAWKEFRQDAIERLDLYENILANIEIEITRILGKHIQNKDIWVASKHKYAELIANRVDVELAETFFSSVTRKILQTIGVDRDIEFFHLTERFPSTKKSGSTYKIYLQERNTINVIRKILGDQQFKIGYENIERDSEFVAREIDLHLWPYIIQGESYTIEVIKYPFYRNKAAYMIGRIKLASTIIPIALPLYNGENGIFVDAVLLNHEDISNIFGFAYSYFHVIIEQHSEMIDFLKSIMPEKSTAELNFSIGYTKHGKTEFYRDLHKFVHISKENFIIAPGKEGAVMIVFTLPNFDFVFKVIKDKPCFLRSNDITSKIISKSEVKQQYDFVIHRDRVGRLVDTQEFENLKFKRKRFSEDLLAEFIKAAIENVTVSENYVVVHHLYIQRKVIPLPIYLSTEKDPEVIRRIIIDFGFFLKDLAGTGIFPSDLFNTWNYGVTPNHRVVLFDYDDVIPLEKASFLEKPIPQDEYDEFIAEEERITASPFDFFLDEIDLYSGIPKPLQGIFNAYHSDLYTLNFWTNIKAKMKDGEILDIYPYDRSKRFKFLFKEL